MNEPPKVVGVRRTSAADEVFKAIHEWIVTGQLNAGDHLPSQDKLAEQFDVSRNTLREAINKLVAMGLLAPKQGIGTVVQPSSPTNYLSSLLGHVTLGPVTIKEFVESRIILERSLVRMAAVRAGGEALARIEETVEAQREAIDAGDIEAFVTHDAAFHLALAAASGNSVLGKFLQTTRELLNRFISAGAEEPGAVELDYDRHQEILEAVRARDPQAAEDCMITHLREAVGAAERSMGVELGVDALLERGRAA